jgi:hypothetical protein
MSGPCPRCGRYFVDVGCPCKACGYVAGAGFNYKGPRDLGLALLILAGLAIGLGLAVLL